MDIDTFNMNDINITDQKIMENPDMKNGIVYDCGEEDITEATLSVAMNVADETIKVLEFMNTTDMITLRKVNMGLFEQTMEDKFPEFLMKQYAVYQMLLSGENIQPMLVMLKTIDNINNHKQSLEEGEKNVGSCLSQFLPSGLMDKLAKESNINNNISKKDKKKNRKRY